MVDGLLDFLVFVLVLGVVITVGLGLIIPVAADIHHENTIQMYDKTIGGRVDVVSVPDQPIDYKTLEELVLTIMSQGQFIPEPGIIDVCGITVSVSNNILFSPLSIATGNTARTSVTNWYTQFRSSPTFTLFSNPPSTIAGVRFKLKFSMNNPTDKNDDTFAVFILLTRNVIGAEPELFRCISGGRLVDSRGLTL